MATPLISLLMIAVIAEAILIRELFLRTRNTAKIIRIVRDVVEEMFCDHPDELIILLKNRGVNFAEWRCET